MYKTDLSFNHRALSIVAVLVILFAFAQTTRGNITVPNHSFEAVDTTQVGGVWPEVDVDPVNNNYWLEPGPVDGDLNAFPPNLIPPGFSPPAGSTLDTGAFFNSPVSFDPGSGGFVPNPSFVTNADGNQIAFLFAKHDLNPPVGFIQTLPDTYEEGSAYQLTVAAGKSFFLPPIGATPTLALQLIYDAGTGPQVAAETLVAVGDVQSTLLTDFTVDLPAAQAGDPWLGEAIGIRIQPASGTSGVWIFDDVRLVPEPSTLALGLAGLLILAGRRRRA